MKRLLTGLLTMGCMLCAAAATEENPAAAASPAKNAPTSAAKPFAAPAVLKGTLGDQRIQATVRPKLEFEDSIEGEYFVFGRSGKILLAGELEGDDIFLEESENGTDVSGQWEGKRRSDTIEGTWTSADGSVSKQFLLRISSGAPAASARPARGKAKALPALVPAPQ